MCEIWTYHGISELGFRRISGRDIDVVLRKMMCDSAFKAIKTLTNIYLIMYVKSDV